MLMDSKLKFRTFMFQICDNNYFHKNESAPLMPKRNSSYICSKSLTNRVGFLLSPLGFSTHPVSFVFRIYFKDFVFGPTISTKLPSGSFNIKRQMS